MIKEKKFAKKSVQNSLCVYTCDSHSYIMDESLRVVVILAVMEMKFHLVFFRISSAFRATRIRTRNDLQFHLYDDHEGPEVLDFSERKNLSQVI